MSLSKHAVDRINKIEEDAMEINISHQKIFDVCKISYNCAVGIELIKHLFGGENMEYKVMGVDNSFECYHVCHQDLLSLLKEDKREILFFEDRKNYTSSAIISIVKQPRTKAKREHLVLLAVWRMTVMVEPKVAICRYMNVTVCKPRLAKTLQDQVDMVTKNAFYIIYKSHEHIRKYLRDGGKVLNLYYDNFEWTWMRGGPQKPVYFIPKTPDASPTTSSSSWEKFPEDTSVMESESDDGDSTIGFINKMVHHKPPTKKFRFRSLSELNAKKYDSPSSSPIPLPSPEVFVISSDKELENSMVKLEEAVSLEMDSD